MYNEENCAALGVVLYSVTESHNGYRDANFNFEDGALWLTQQPIDITAKAEDARLAAGEPNVSHNETQLKQRPLLHLHGALI